MPARPLGVLAGGIVVGETVILLLAERLGLDRRQYHLRREDVHLRMQSLTAELVSLVTQAITAAFGDAYASIDPVLRRSKASIPADYQSNVAFALAKQVGQPPREVAALIVEQIDTTGAISEAEVAGGGFINVRVDAAHLARLLERARGDERLGLDTVPVPEVVVIDYSSPNAAKELHVGHLRSTLIGDALARLLTFAGHRVIRQNHLGDWGTQFGMLIEYLVANGAATETELTIADLDSLYRAARTQFESDPEFGQRARDRVVALQSGDPETMALWSRLIAESKRHLDRLYRSLDVLLDDGDYRGESSYNPMLADVCEMLTKEGIAEEEQGALCVFLEGFVGRDDKPLPIILRKSDGGYGYEATDAAALRYRTGELDATWLVYVVDVRQSQRLAMLFALGRRAGWLDEQRRAVHVGFGMVLGDDGRPLMTREGENVKLDELLAEANDRARALLAERNDDAVDTELLAHQVGVGAIKYGDLANDRASNYTFDWERLIRFDGNTAPYLQYAVARIHSIFRRAAELSATSGSIDLGAPEEWELALGLATWGEAVLHATAELRPHILCTYLFELSSLFTAFYEACPIMRAPDESTRASRLALCELTQRTLSTGLDLLGIAAPTRM